VDRAYQSRYPRPGPCDLDVTTLGPVRLSHFRELMEGEFGAARAGSLARDHVFAELGGRTAEQAIEAGIDPKNVWRAVCDAYDVPPARRLGADDS
jgi:hypothetical protein